MQPSLLEYLLLVKNYGRIFGILLGEDSPKMHCDELSEMVQNMGMAILVIYLGLLTY